jgi:hypothetical protein
MRWNWAAFVPDRSGSVTSQPRAIQSLCSQNSDWKCRSGLQLKVQLCTTLAIMTVVEGLSCITYMKSKGAHSQRHKLLQSFEQLLWWLVSWFEVSPVWISVAILGWYASPDQLWAGSEDLKELNCRANIAEPCYIQTQTVHTGMLWTPVCEENYNIVYSSMG